MFKILEHLTLTYCYRVIAGGFRSGGQYVSHLFGMYVVIQSLPGDFFFISPGLSGTIRALTRILKM